MGSSQKKKREKQKDFQVSHLFSSLFIDSLLTPDAETQAQSRQGKTKARQFHRYQLSVKRYMAILTKSTKSTNFLFSHRLEPAVSPHYSSISQSSILASCVPLIRQVRLTTSRIAGTFDDVRCIASRQLAPPTASERDPTQSASIDPRCKQRRANAAAQAAPRSSTV